jgi:hypothetical protein
LCSGGGGGFWCGLTVHRLVHTSVHTFVTPLTHPWRD